MSNPQPESIIKRHIYHYLSMCPEFYGFVVSNSGIYDAKKGTYRTRTGTGMKNGVSDILGLWNGKGLAIEVKTKTGKLSDNQKLFLAEYEAAGGIAVVLRSVDDAVAWVAKQRTTCPF